MLVRSNSAISENNMQTKELEVGSVFKAQKAWRVGLGGEAAVCLGIFH